MWLTGVQALNFAICLLRKWLGQGRIESKPLVLRTYLIRSSKYKESFLKRRIVEPKPHTDLISLYRALPLPRFIWVSEYSFLDNWINNKTDRLLINGEFIFDSNLLTPDVDHDWLGQHLQGGVMTNHVDADRLSSLTTSLPEDQPYLCLTTPSYYAVTELYAYSSEWIGKSYS